MLYGLVHALCTAVWFRDSPAALVGLAALCAGDGMAEVAGRAWGGKRTLPHNKSKVRAADALAHRDVKTWCCGAIQSVPLAFLLALGRRRGRAAPRALRPPW